MTYENPAAARHDDVMDALGDRTRRAVLERLRGGPRAVGDIADALPVSRPAVSQHLRVLKDAGLVRHRPQGTRRLYELHPEGLAALRAYVEGFWNEALARFVAAAETRQEGENDVMDQATLTPLRKTVRVEAPVEKAWRTFTRDLKTWWPLTSHSIGGERVEIAVMEGRAGGRIYERWTDGQEFDWGRVLVWEPPRRVAFSWHPGHPLTESTEVEVRFVEEGGATIVELEHRHWERLGDRAPEIRSSYDTGWDAVLDRYLEGVRDSHGAER